MSLEYQGRTIDDAEIRDLLSTIPELQAEVSQLKKVLRSITAMCNAPHWTAERRWKIEALASGREKAVF